MKTDLRQSNNQLIDIGNEELVHVGNLKLFCFIVKLLFLDSNCIISNFQHFVTLLCNNIR